jgi:hypothetical protein
MKLPQGQHKIINVLSPNSSELDMPQFQILMRRANNCKATLWKCSACNFKKRADCLAKVRNHLQMEALKKYGDTPQMKQAIDERIKKEKNQKATRVLGVQGNDE